jgi:hypothetical protein
MELDGLSLPRCVDGSGTDCIQSTLVFSDSLALSQHSTSHGIAMAPSAQKKRAPVVRDLNQWIEIAKSLIDKGLGSFVWSGLTLDDWYAVLCAPQTRFIRQTFAVHAVQGITATYFRQQLGKAADNLSISLSFIPPAESEAGDDDQAVA